MKKIQILILLVLFAFVATQVVVAQENKDAKKSNTECSKEKAGDKKECCNKEKAGDKKECCKEKAGDKKECCDKEKAGDKKAVDKKKK